MGAVANASAGCCWLWLPISHFEITVSSKLKSNLCLNCFSFVRWIYTQIKFDYLKQRISIWMLFLFAHKICSKEFVDKWLWRIKPHRFQFTGFPLSPHTCRGMHMQLGLKTYTCANVHIVYQSLNCILTEKSMTEIVTFTKWQWQRQP